MNHKDNRARLTNAILSDIKIIKLYGWEEAFMEKVLGIRKQELQALKSSQILFSLSVSSFHSSTFLVSSISSSTAHTLLFPQHHSCACHLAVKSNRQMAAQRSLSSIHLILQWASCWQIPAPSLVGFSTHSELIAGSGPQYFL